MDRKSQGELRASSRRSRRSQPIVLPDILKLEFNMIITRFESIVPQFADIMKLLIEVVFNGEKMTITPSRINVSELNPDAGLDISVKPEILIKNLQRCGLPIVAYYNGALMGSAQITFPDVMFEEIMDGVPTQTFFDSCEIKMRSKVNARLEVFYQLRVKCDVPLSK